MSLPRDILDKYVKSDIGSFHPINQTKDYLIKLLESHGFKHIEGPEIESENYNFDMLNIKKSHPARQMHDTFYVNKKKALLRTHTSPVQIRALKKKNIPLAIISSGKVYRKDDDSTHLPMFHQIEGILVDEGINFSNLKGLIFKIIEDLFPEVADIRFRPSYFPFT